MARIRDLLGLRVSLKKRFLVGMSAMLVPIVVLAWSSVRSLERTNYALMEVIEESFEEVRPVLYLRTAVLRAAMPARDYGITGNPRQRMAFQIREAEVEEVFRQVRTAPFARAVEREHIVQAAREWEEIRRLSKEALDAPDPVGNPSVTQKIEAMDLHVERLSDLTGLVHDTALAEMEEQILLAQKAQRRMIGQIAVVVAAGLLAAFTIGRFLARSVLNPIERLKKGAERFAANDLSYRVEAGAEDELGALARAFNKMAQTLEKGQSALEYLATHDNLTGAYNHREFHLKLEEELERARRYGRPLALLMLDLDRFKEINDRLGHQAGDEVLRAVSHVLKRQVRSIDHVARYGGEEFSIILPETGSENAFNTAERIRGAVEAAAIEAAGAPVRITVSIGVASFPEDAGDEKELISKADGALYAAKQAGRNTVRAASGQGETRG